MSPSPRLCDKETAADIRTTACRRDEDCSRDEEAEVRGQLPFR